MNIAGREVPNTYVYAGGALGAYFLYRWYKNNQASQAASTASQDTGTAADNGFNPLGEVGAMQSPDNDSQLQSEIAGLSRHEAGADRTIERQLATKENKPPPKPTKKAVKAPPKTGGPAVTHGKPRPVPTPAGQAHNVAGRPRRAA